MSAQLPAPEALWRHFRKAPEGEALLDATRAHIDQLWRMYREDGMDRATLQRIQRDVPWPLMATWNLEQMLRQAEAINSPAPQGYWAASASVHLTWRDTGKRVYRLTPELAAGLRQARWPASFPAAHLRPPVGAVWLELPLDDELVHVAWYLDLHTDRYQEGLYELRLVGPPSGSEAAEYSVARGLMTPRIILDLSAGTLDDALTAALARVEHNAKTLVDQPDEIVIDAIADAWSGTNPIVRCAVNALLYILGDEDVVQQVHPGAPPAASAPRGRPITEREERLRDLSEPAWYDVGRAYGAAIERWADAREAEAHGAGSGERSVRPHMRAAHAHLYWTGPGRTVPRVRYLPPIPVKAWAPDRDDDAPVIEKPTR